MTRPRTRPDRRKQFLQRLGIRGRVRDLQAVTGLSRKTVRWWARYRPTAHGMVNVARNRRHSSQAALARMHDDYLAGKVTDAWQPEGEPDAQWSHDEIMYLTIAVGTRRLALIAAVIHRTEWACRAMLRRLPKPGTEPWQISIRYLARRLGVRPREIARMADALTLRSYRDGRRRYIHRDDALWLIRYWQPTNLGTGQRNPVSKHPGKDL